MTIVRYMAFLVLGMLLGSWFVVSWGGYFIRPSCARGVILRFAIVSWGG